MDCRYFSYFILPEKDSIFRMRYIERQKDMGLWQVCGQYNFFFFLKNYKLLLSHSDRPDQY